MALAGAEQVAPSVEAVTVIGATPLPGTRLDIAKAPYDVRSLTASDLVSGGVSSVTDSLSSRLGGVSINENLDDPFQPDLLYRGFEASPVLGTPQGLAVYQNGVRINEAFGDTVNWDLVPSDAVSRMDVVGTNPVYGLNALGGAVIVTMKNGFDNPDRQVEASVGSYGRRSLSLTFGGHADRWAGFVTARGLDQDGWRLLSSDRVRQIYGAVSHRSDRLMVDLSYTGADNALHGESPSPVQELAVGRKLIFSSPQLNANSLNFVAMNASYRASSTLTVQANAYVRDFRQSVVNGNTTGYVACAGPGQSGLLCQSDGTTPLVSTTLAAIPDLSAGGTLPIGQKDTEHLHTTAFGGTWQATSTAAMVGHGNQISVGAAVNNSRTDYGSAAEVGVINTGLVVQPSGFTVATPEETAFTATPVQVRSRNSDLGVFITDTLDLTDRLSITASGRFNRVRIALYDRRGTSLSGTNIYSRFNPAFGAAYRLSDGVSLYGGYAEGSRAPTASEIECSDPLAPCLLPSSLSSDPPNLKQVVSRTFEAGLRGSQPFLGGRAGYSISAYRTEVHDDIYAVSASLSAGYFQNINGTRREGGSIDLTYQDDRLSLFASYAHVNAVFDSNFLIPAPSNPLQDANGNIEVRKGDQLPGIPRDRLKLGVDYQINKALNVGGEVQAVSSQYYRGDEANRLSTLPGYAVVGLHASYDITHRLQGFLKVENLLNARYATFGVLGDPTGIGAPGVPANGVTNGVGVDNRFQSPAAPTVAYGGLRYAF